MKVEMKKRILDTKWKNLEKRGLKRPKDSAENRLRIRAAHTKPAKKKLEAHVN